MAIFLRPAATCVVPRTTTSSSHIMTVKAPRLVPLRVAARGGHSFPPLPEQAPPAQAQHQQSTVSQPPAPPGFEGHVFSPVSPPPHTPLATPHNLDVVCGRLAMM